jgi:hypothetical protein
MKKLFTGLFLIICISGFAGKKYEINFLRPVKAGQKLKCDIKVKNTTFFKFMEAGAKKPAETQIRYEARITGTMNVIKATEYGGLGLVDFEVSSFSGNLNGKDCPDSLSGKTLSINLDGKLLPVFKFKSNGQKVSPEAQKLLSLIFRPSRKEGLKDIMGVDHAVEIGDTWQAPLKMLIESFKKRDMELEESQLTGKVTLKAIEKVAGIDCWRLEEKIKTKDVKDFEFEFKASVWLPVDQKTGTVKALRYGYERLTKDLPSKNPLAAGKKITANVIEQMEYLTIPVK